MMQIPGILAQRRASGGATGNYYLSIPHDVSPFVTIYKRSGDVFTKLANPATLPTGNGLYSPSVLAIP